MVLFLEVLLYPCDKLLTELHLKPNRKTDMKKIKPAHDVGVSG